MFMNNLFATLDPSIKGFISCVVILGPICILAMISLLKKIEKENPDKIRWR